MANLRIRSGENPFNTNDPQAYGGHSVSLKEWDILDRPNAYLNDEIINSTLCVLSRGDSPGFITPSTHWFTQVENSLGADATADVGDEEAMANFVNGEWLATVNLDDIHKSISQLWKLVFSKSRGPGVFDDFERRSFLDKVNLIIIPVHADFHWMLVTVHLRSKAVGVWNSMRHGYVRVEKRYLLIIRRWLSLVFGPKFYQDEQWRTLAGRGPQQEDTNQCGVFLLSNAAELIQGFAPPTRHHVDTVLQRQHIQLELMLHSSICHDGWAKYWKPTGDMVLRSGKKRASKGLGEGSGSRV